MVDVEALIDDLCSRTIQQRPAQPELQGTTSSEGGALERKIWMGKIGAAFLCWTDWQSASGDGLYKYDLKIEHDYGTIRRTLPITAQFGRNAVCNVSIIAMLVLDTDSDHAREELYATLGAVSVYVGTQDGLEDWTKSWPCVLPWIAMRSVHSIFQDVQKHAAAPISRSNGDQTLTPVLCQEQIIVSPVWISKRSHQKKSFTYGRYSTFRLGYKSRP